MFFKHCTFTFYSVIYGGIERINMAITQEQREQFNTILKGIDMVLMNNIPEVDPSIWEQIPDEQCDIEQISKNGEDDGLTWFHCSTHDLDTLSEWECEDYSVPEVYQWYAVGAGDAEYLENHNQIVVYSELLDTHFLAITHWGTSWDYVDSMVSDFLELKND